MVLLLSDNKLADLWHRLLLIAFLFFNSVFSCFSDGVRCGYDYDLLAIIKLNLLMLVSSVDTFNKYSFVKFA